MLFSNYSTTPKPGKSVEEISKNNFQLTLTREKKQTKPQSHLLSNLHCVLNHLSESTAIGKTRFCHSEWQNRNNDTLSLLRRCISASFSSCETARDFSFQRTRRDDQLKGSSTERCTTVTVDINELVTCVFSAETRCQSVGVIRPWVINCLNGNLSVFHLLIKYFVLKLFSNIQKSTLPWQWKTPCRSHKRSLPRSSKFLHLTLELVSMSVARSRQAFPSESAGCSLCPLIPSST